jgi:hypothetical protein
MLLLGDSTRLVFEEHEIPEELHPERDQIDKHFKSGIFRSTINRRTLLDHRDGQLLRSVEPLKN